MEDIKKINSILFQSQALSNEPNDFFWDVNSKKINFIENSNSISSDAKEQIKECIKVRRDKNLSITQLAKELNISVSLISRLESGQMSFTKKVCNAYNKYFNTDFKPINFKDILGISVEKIDYIEQIDKLIDDNIVLLKMVKELDAKLSQLYGLLPLININMVPLSVDDKVKLKAIRYRCGVANKKIQKYKEEILNDKKTD